MTTIKGKIRDTIYPNGKGAITAEKHQSLLLDVVDNINELKQDTLVSGQNIRPLISGESLLGSDALGVLGTKFIYELENQQLFAMIDGAQQDFHIWMANRAVHSQVAQVIEIQKEGYFKELVPLTIKNKAGVAVLCWEYDGMIYEASMEDNVLAVVSKPKGDEFDKEGNYPSLHVGTADDLAGRGESVPAQFGFRASGGKSIKDGRAYIKRIKGNSMVWNQYSKNFVDYDSGWHADYYPSTSSLNYDTEANTLTISAKGGEATLVGKLLCSFKAGHKILVSFGLELKTNVERTGNPYLGYFSAPTQWLQRISINDFSNKRIEQNTFVTLSSDTKAFFLGSYGGNLSETLVEGDKIVIYSPRIIDLTQMFGAGNEPTTIEEFNARKPMIADEYAYNEGEVIHMNTESIKSVGDNAWDEEWELGVLNSTGILTPNDTRIRTKNFTRVIPNETYYFYGHYGWGVYFYDADKNYVTTLYVNNNKLQIPSNAMYLKFNFPTDYGTTYKGDYMISLVHSGWKQDTDAGYQPYWQDILPLPIIRKYFPDGMKSAGTAHDEIRYNKASGKWEYTKSKTGGGRIKGVRLADLTWTFFQNYRYFYSNDIADIRVHNTADLFIICNVYGATDWRYFVQNYQGNKLPMIAPYTNTATTKTRVNICDTTLADAESLNAHLEETDAMLYYESNDWEWVELDAEDQNFRDYYNVADFGTEEAIPATDAEGNIIPSANFSADIIYQFNAVDMIREHEIEITELQKVIATMQAQLTALTNGGQ
jgi:hypothetical protein